MALRSSNVNVGFCVVTKWVFAALKYTVDSTCTGVTQQRGEVTKPRPV